MNFQSKKIAQHKVNISKIASSIFKTLILSLLIVGQVNLATAQTTASILPPAKTTFNDQNGKPLTGGSVAFSIPGTTTAKTTWQDAAETIPNANPVVLDSAGRAIILGSGSYRQQVFDKFNNLIWDQVTASANGGSSGPTATGDGDLVGTIKPWAGITAPNQYMFAAGQQVSRVLFPSLFTAITSVQTVTCSSGNQTITGLTDTTQFWIGMSVEVNCLASGSSTITAKTSTSVTLAGTPNTSVNTPATFFPWGNGNATTTFTLPDLRGFVVAGNNNMGGTANTVLTTAFFGATNPNSSGAAGGSQSVTLLTTNLPAYTPTGANAASSVTFNIGTPSLVAQGTGFAGQTTTGAGVFFYSSGQYSGATATAAAQGFLGAAQGGTSTPFSLVQPTKTANYIIKVTPDSNSATASGVTSLGLMTGDIGCGAGLSCTGNVISVTETITPCNTGVPIVGTGLTTPVACDANALGTAAFVNTGTSGATLGFLNTANTWSASQTFPSPVFSGTVTGTYTLGGSPTITGGALSGTFSGTPTFSGANFLVLSNLVQSTAGAQFLGVSGASSANYSPFTLASLVNLSTPNASLDLIPIVDHTTGTIKNVTPGAIASSATAGVSSLNGQTGPQIAYFPPQGRLTLTSLTPVMGTSVAAATTVIYTPYTGNMVPMFNGSNMVPIVVAEISQATTDTTQSPAAVAASSCYDNFVWNPSSPKLSRGPVWTNETTRSAGTALTLTDGIFLNSVAITNGPGALAGTYVGTFCSNASSTVDYIFGTIASGGGMASFDLWNAYNRVPVDTVVGDSTSSWTYSVSSVWRAANGNATMRINAVRGLNVDGITASYNALMEPGASTISSVGIGVSATTSFNGTTGSTSIAGGFISQSAHFSGLMGLGLTFVSANEFNNTTTASTFFGNSGASTFLQSGLEAALWQ